ncbi:outer membrane protein assembly factor BamA [Lacibacterium aquatile]|uniref:Outer membrane protein assembly factor BamA n=1 Tax=Lacibacterium aquatile TaxID=1168082 RepID=A0ABW5DLB0_9PROT
MLAVTLLSGLVLGAVEVSAAGPTSKAALPPPGSTLAQAPAAPNASAPPPAAAPRAPVQSQSISSTAYPPASQIRVEGTQRIEPDTVRSYLTIKVGDPLSPGEIDKSLKGLFATGLFADVSVGVDGSSTLVVRVVENPIINRIAFEGGKKLTEKELLPEIQLRPRVVYTRTKVQQDVSRLLDVYRRNGRFAATIEPKIIELDQNRVDLVFEINEGEATTVSKITFIGNKEFSDSTLRTELVTAESRWYRFWASDDSYDPDRVAYDRELLRRFYQSEGYADFRVVSSAAELGPDRKNFFITHVIEEGNRYKIGKVEVVSQLKEFDPALVKEYIRVKEGDWYSLSDSEATVSQLSQRTGNLGYAFVEVDPQIKRNAEDQTIDITYVISEGPKVYVERIDIVGNVRTLDKVVRREFRLVEGDAFNSDKLRRSERRIKDLTFFKSVQVTQEPGSAADKVVLKAKVEEQSTGELSVGGGVSTADGPLGLVQVRERNLMGRGQDLSVSTTLAARRTQFDISFTEPYFLDRPVAFTTDLFHTRRDLTDFSSYNWQSTGGSFSFNYFITEYWRQRLGYTLRRDVVTDVDSDASIYIKDQEGKTISSYVTHELAYDRRDSRISPTEGYMVRVTHDVAGLGGTAKYIRSKLRGEYHLPLADEVVLSLAGDVANITGFGGERLRINDRFFVGGDTFRGFSQGGVGPRDTKSDDALGAKNYAVNSVELAFPSGLPKDLGISMLVFHDIGTAWGAEDSGPDIRDSTKLRASAGVGFKWQSPFGPIRVDVGYPYLKDEFDDTEFFRFSFGTKF